MLTNEGVQLIEDLIDNENVEDDEISIVIDRMTGAGAKNEVSRLADSIETAFFEGRGDCNIVFPDTNEVLNFNNRFERDGIVFDDPRPDLFSFNSPDGACPTCEGFGPHIRH